MDLTGTLATQVAMGCLILAAICLLFVTANPHKMRRVSREQFANIISSSRQKELLTLSDAWAGSSRISDFQLKLISYLGLILGVAFGLSLRSLLGTVYSVLIAGVLGFGLWYYANNRFVAGFRKTMIEALEREAPVFSAFMHRAIGVTGLSVQMSFEQFKEVYPDKETSKLISHVPDGLPIAEAVLDLGLPVQDIPNWIQVIQVISSISEFGEPESILKEMRNRIRKREEQYLRMMIKRKAFAAPAATVVIMLPGLMCVLIGSVLLQAIQTLTGGG